MILSTKTNISHALLRCYLGVYQYIQGVWNCGQWVKDEGAGLGCGDEDDRGWIIESERTILAAKYIFMRQLYLANPVLIHLANTNL